MNKKAWSLYLNGDHTVTLLYMSFFKMIIINYKWLFVGH